jgi:hypothetical protein
VDPCFTIVDWVEARGSCISTNFVFCLPWSCCAWLCCSSFGYFLNVVNSNPRLTTLLIFLSTKDLVVSTWKTCIPNSCLTSMTLFWSSIFRIL